MNTELGEVMEQTWVGQMIQLSEEQIEELLAGLIGVVSLAEEPRRSHLCGLLHKASIAALEMGGCHVKECVTNPGWDGPLQYETQEEEADDPGS